MATYVFLIMVISSRSASLQIEPMKDMAQCNAAIAAIKIADDQRSWSEVSPYVDNVKCVEVKP